MDSHGTSAGLSRGIKTGEILLGWLKFRWLDVGPRRDFRQNHRVSAKRLHTQLRPISAGLISLFKDLYARWALTFSAPSAQIFNRWSEIHSAAEPGFDRMLVRRHHVRR